MLRLLEHGPVVHMIVLVPLARVNVPEKLAKVGIVRLVVKAQRPYIIEVGGKFLGVSLPQVVCVRAAMVGQSVGQDG